MLVIGRSISNLFQISDALSKFNDNTSELCKVLGSFLETSSIDLKILGAWDDNLRYDPVFYEYLLARCGPELTDLQSKRHHELRMQEVRTGVPLNADQLSEFRPLNGTYKYFWNCSKEALYLESYEAQKAYFIPLPE